MRFPKKSKKREIQGCQYRQTEGFIDDVFKKIDLNLNVVSNTQILSRQSDLEINIRCEEHCK